MTKQEEGKLRSKFTRWPPSWIIWAFQVSRPPQILRVSLTIVYTWQDHGLESLKMAFFLVILDSKFSKMTPKFFEAEVTVTPLINKICNPCIIMAWFLSPQVTFGSWLELQVAQCSEHSTEESRMLWAGKMILNPLGWPNRYKCYSAA